MYVNIHVCLHTEDCVCLWWELCVCESAHLCRELCVPTPGLGGYGKGPSDNPRLDGGSPCSQSGLCGGGGFLGFLLLFEGTLTCSASEDGAPSFPLTQSPGVGSPAHGV